MDRSPPPPPADLRRLAHELNNSVFVLGGNVELLAALTPPGSATTVHLRRLEEAVLQLRTVAQAIHSAVPRS